MSLRKATQVRRADVRRVASRVCSYVQPVRPGEVPRRRRVSRVLNVSGVTQMGGTSVGGTRRGSSLWWRAARCCMTSDVTVARGRTYRQRAARPTLPVCRGECMRAAKVRPDGCAGQRFWWRALSEPEATGSAASGWGPADCAVWSLARMRRCLPLPGETVRQKEGSRRRVRIAATFPPDLDRTSPLNTFRASGHHRALRARATIVWNEGFERIRTGEPRCTAVVVMRVSQLTTDI
jgi:hypothetical protein